MVNLAANLPPFSRPVEVAAIGEAGATLTVTANETERAALARVNGLIGIARLTATFDIAREGSAGCHVTGAVEGDIRQTCVATLEPFDSVFVEPVDVRFLSEAALAALARRKPAAPVPGEDAPLEEDLPDPIVGGRIDLGALAAEFLALGLDPYPKKPDAVFVEPAPRTADAAEDSPFAILAKIKAPDRSEP